MPYRRQPSELTKAIETITNHHIVSHQLPSMRMKQQNSYAVMTLATAPIANNTVPQPQQTQRQGKGASASATLLCICSVVLIYLDLR
jgi:hypothetical protein